MTDTGARALAFAIIQQAINDYIDYKVTNYNGTGERTQSNARDDVKRFFRSDWFEILVDGAFQGNVEPSYIIEQTIKKARAQDMKKARKAVE